jgi:hypothetical protein
MAGIQIHSLRTVKLLHTAAWTFFAGCIVLIPVAAWYERYVAVLVMAGFVFIETLMLALNDWKCPLTRVAARYTQDRNDNFDIYLPLWLARYNKEIFGPLFVLGLVFALARWFELVH